jgi:hypothetical protein
MKLDSAIKIFLEKYDEFAIASIEAISKDISLTNNKRYIVGFNITESFDKFIEFIDGYAKYKIENMDNPEASSHDNIINHTNNFIESKLFNESNILYADLPVIIKGYIKGIKQLIETVDNAKGTMLESGVDTNSIATVNDFVDTFLENFHFYYDPMMENVLWATGYNTKIRLSKRNKKEVPIFI